MTRRTTALGISALLTIGLGVAGPAVGSTARAGGATFDDGCQAGPPSGGSAAIQRAASTGAVQDVVADGTDDVWAAGEVGTHAKAQHWDGAAWTSWTLPGLPAGEQDVTASGIARIADDDVWVVGTLDNAAGAERAFSEHWDGTAWQRVPLPAVHGATTQLSSVSGTATGDVWAVGSSFDQQTCLTIGYVLHWDGSSWSMVRAPARSAAAGRLQTFEPADVVALSADDAWLVGEAGTDRGRMLALTEHWNGHAWKVVADPSGPQLTWLNSVSGTASDDVWAVGARVSDIGRTLVQHNDATGWSQARSADPSAHDYLLGVDATDPHTAWAVGFEGESGGTGLVERWNGHRWLSTTAPSGVNALISVATISNTDVWVGAASSRAGHPAALEHWDGSSWTRVPFPS